MVVVADAPTLPRYVSLVNNVRGVAVYDPADPPERDLFTWLSRRHQYRNVGIPGCLVDHPTVDLTEYKTIEVVDPPTAGGRDLVDGVEDVEGWVAESLLLGSAYAAPLFIDPPALAAFSPAAAWELSAEPSLESDQVLRHMRIAGYGTVDFLESTADDARRAIREGAVDALVADRAERAERDGEDRFWRLLEGEEAGDRPVGGYYDPLPLLTEDGRERVLDSPDLSVYLGLVGGFIVDREAG